MRRIVGLVVLCGATLVGACSGGGSQTTVPHAVATLPGAGTAAAFNQKVTFEIEVPAETGSTAGLRRVRAAATSPAPSATPTATTPYLSPLTGSVQLILAEVNGTSPQQAPPVIAPVNVPASCQGSATGCTIPVANIPAALGTDRYFVQTFTGPNATGTLISSGFVDVVVPNSQANPTIGGSAVLSIGGYVASIDLAPAALSFVQGTASSQNVLVQALDAAGATIIGAAQFVTPITVRLTDTQNFTIGGASTATVTGPLQQPLVLHYGGGISASGGTLVEATSVNSSGASVAATSLVASVLAPGSTPTAPPSILPAPPAPGASAPGATASSAPTGSPSPSPTAVPTAVPTPLPTSPPTGIATPVPTPRPTATPKPTKQLSLYVADANTDTVSEYRIVSQIVNGLVPNPSATPSRVIVFDPTKALSSVTGNLPLSCFGQGSGNGTAGVAVDPNIGTIFIQPNCNNGVNGFVFGYSPSAVGDAVPTITDPFSPAFGTNYGLAVNATTLFSNYFTSTEQISGFPLTSSGNLPTTQIGGTCFNELGNPSPGCFDVYASGIGADNSGFVYEPAVWNDTAIGDAAAYTNPAAVLALTTPANSATVTPYAAIAGLNSAVGGSGNPAPAAATVAGSILYVFTGAANLALAANQATQYYAGLSDCPAPSANAPINQLASTTSSNCADAGLHTYVAAYNIPELIATSAFGTDVDLAPDFLIGGDVVGGFGCAPTYPGQDIAVTAGFVFVLNEVPSCPGGQTVGNPEIDVYNTNAPGGGSISYAHTDIAPLVRIPLTTIALPIAIAIGPSGTVTGGQALLHRRGTGSYNEARFAARWAAAKARRDEMRAKFHRLPRPQ